MKLKPNPITKPADDHAARELFYYVQNNAQIYTTGVLPAIANLKKKIANGTYDAAKAVQLWKLVAMRAAVAYGNEHGNGDGLKIFTPRTRLKTAEMLADRFDAQAIEHEYTQYFKSNPDIHVDINSHNQSEAEGYMKNPGAKRKQYVVQKLISGKQYWIKIIDTDNKNDALRVANEIPRTGKTVAVRVLDRYAK